MGEAIIAGGGRTNDGSPKMKWVDFTEIITENREYTVPECRNQEIEVFLVGGGGGSYKSNRYIFAGCGGFYNKKNVQVSAGSIVPITIGAGGINSGGSGGITSFGSYVSANGGSQYIGSSGCGGGGVVVLNSNYLFQIGFQYGMSPGKGDFGGGGGGVLSTLSTHAGGTAYNNRSYVYNGGNGGMYGGGGGGGGSFDSMHASNGWAEHYRSYSCPGTGGEYGGNGGFVFNDPYNNRTGDNSGMNGNNGINTSTWTNVDTYFLDNSYFRGYGIGGKGFAGKNSQGVYGGGPSGGGGGFGGNGGNSSHFEMGPVTGNRVGGGGAGGGGGGYGADGGDGASTSDSISICAFGGGGGGCGDNGGTAIWYGSGYGGGYSPAAYGRGGSWQYTVGRSGLCILKYQKLVYV